jgi:hypothetical protein
MGKHASGFGSEECTYLTDQQYTNQFPFEACLVMKNHLAETIHKVSYQECPVC